MSAEWLWFIASALGSSILTGIVRHFWIASGMLDLPNSRSSHTRPMPRGGGIGIAVTILVGLIAVASLHAMETPVLGALMSGGVAIAVVGYADDKVRLRALPRLLVHALAAAFAVLLLTGQEGARPIFAELPAPVLFGLLLLGVIWSINLFNFMDGIDGIAGTQAVFMAAASLFLIDGAADEALTWRALCALTAGGCAGFLLWNWPPAKIFMGDVGSGFLGFWLGTLAIALHASGALSLWISLILGAVFLADATATLSRRVASGQKWYEAHRSHAYQWLTRRLESHKQVTLLVCAINLTVVLPAAFVARRLDAFAPWIALTLLAILFVTCLALGAGRTERPAE